MRIWAGCAIVLFSVSCASARPEVVPPPRPAVSPDDLANGTVDARLNLHAHDLAGGASHPFPGPIRI